MKSQFPRYQAVTSKWLVFCDNPFVAKTRLVSRKRDDNEMGSKMAKIYIIALTLAALAFTPSSWVNAQEDREKAESQKNAQEAVAPKTYFRVYAGNCSRSMKFRGNHLSFAEAISAKRLLDDRGYLRTEIRSTNILRGEDLWDDSLNVEISYHIFRPTNKGWQLSAAFENRTDVQGFIADVTREQNPTYLEVVHYTFSIK